MKITFLPSNQIIEVQEAATILEIAKQYGYLIDAPCAGNRTCGKCKVLVTKGNDYRYTKEEEYALTEEERLRGYRLACCCKVGNEMCCILPQQRKKDQQVSPMNYTRIEKRERKTRTGREKLGIAIDLGTTSIVMSIWDMEHKVLLGKTSMMNPQRDYGADVIARIQYSYQSREKVKKLQQLVVEACNAKIKEVLEQAGYSEELIKQYVVVGNTTMCHLFLGYSIDGLAKAPVTMEYTGDCERRAKDIGLCGTVETMVYVLPSIGGHVGADALSCALAIELEQQKGNCLIIDVGTNGEMILKTEDRMVACSTAAGPAFEGANITCGMSAVSGAITRVFEHGENLVFETVGNVAPIGISGSGIIDILSVFLNKGKINKTGNINTNDMENIHGRPSISITKGKVAQPSVYLTQEDIRQVQLAKGAIYAGVEVMLKECGVDKSKLDHVYLAGTFGSNINLRNGIRIGLLPDIPIERIQYLGNAALQGAEAVLFQKEEKRIQSNRLANKIYHLELANIEKFQSIYLQELNFR